MQASWLGATARLTALVTCVGLLTSRLGLIVHELIGHGGVALAVGGEVTDVHLFWLAGGWVRYRLSDGGAFAVALGGIVVEIVAGSALWIALARRPQTFVRRVARAVGAALVLHATWYLATGTWHGYGDGLRLHRLLGDGRYAVAIGAGAVTCAAAYLGARLVLGALAATIPGRRPAWLGGTALALLVAGVVQFGGAVGEVRLRRDAGYAQIMRPERDRIVDRELAAWARGREVDATERARRAAELAAQHRGFPFAIVLGVMVVLAGLLGARASQRGETERIASRVLAFAALAAAGSIAVVIAIDLAFH